MTCFSRQLWLGSNIIGDAVDKVMALSMVFEQRI